MSEDPENSGEEGHKNTQEWGKWGQAKMAGGRSQKPERSGVMGMDLAFRAPCTAATSRSWF